MIKAEFKIDQRFKQRLKVRYERFQFEAGVLENKPHFRALPAKKGLTTVSGGPARRKSRVKVDGSVADVGERLRKAGADYLREPIKQWQSEPMRAFRAAWNRLITGLDKSRSKTETALRRVIREPILRQKYGRNTKATARAKGFNRKLIDTGQFFQAIIAKVLVKRV